MLFRSMTYAEAESLPYNPFDLTKVPISPSHSHLHCRSPGTSSNCDFISAPHHLQTLRSRIYFSSLTDILLLPSLHSTSQVWSHAAFPLHEIGRMVLDRNPQNYFAEIEQLAFAPSHLIPGTSSIHIAILLSLEASLLTLPVLSKLLIFRNRAITR